VVSQSISAQGEREHGLQAGLVLDAVECVLVGAAASGVAGLGEFAGVGVEIGGAGEGAGGLLAGDGAKSPCLVDGDGGQPGEAARVERDVGAAQQRGPGGVAGVFDDLVTNTWTRRRTARMSRSAWSR
jgi:hypothetical protein